MDCAEVLKNFLNDEGKLISYPARRKMKYYALYYIASAFEQGREYTEKEVNAVIDGICVFGDFVTVRRDLFDARFLDRETNGTRYRLRSEFPTLEMLGISS